MATDDPKDIVRSGYNSISYLYRGDDDAPPKYTKWAHQLISLLPPPLRPILDVGCGCGIPFAQILANAGYAVTGIDLSEVQIQRARSLVPQATFIRGDVTSKDIVDEVGVDAKFAAVAAFYVLIHIPVKEQRDVVRQMARWLENGGYCMLIAGIRALELQQGGWLGADESVQMWWNQAGVEEYRLWIREVGLEILQEEFIPEEGSEGHQFFLLRKTA